MQLLAHEIKHIQTQLTYLRKLEKTKSIQMVEAGEQSTENYMHDDAPQQIAVEEGRVIQSRIDELRAFLHDAIEVPYPVSNKKIQIGHRVTFTINNQNLSIEIVGFPSKDASSHVSIESPIGKAFIGKKVDNHFAIGKNTYHITDIETPTYNM